MRRLKQVELDVDEGAFAPDNVAQSSGQLPPEVQTLHGAHVAPPALLARPVGDDEGEARLTQQRAELTPRGLKLVCFETVEAQLDDVRELRGAHDRGAQLVRVPHADGDADACLVRLTHPGNTFWRIYTAAVARSTDVRKPSPSDVAAVALGVYAEVARGAFGDARRWNHLARVGGGQRAGVAWRHDGGLDGRV